MCKKFLVLTKIYRSRTEGPALVSNTLIVLYFLNNTSVLSSSHPRLGWLCFQFVSAAIASASTAAVTAAAASPAAAAATTFFSHIKTFWAKPKIFGTKNKQVWWHVLIVLLLQPFPGHMSYHFCCFRILSPDPCPIDFSLSSYRLFEKCATLQSNTTSYSLVNGSPVSISCRCERVENISESD